MSLNFKFLVTQQIQICFYEKFLTVGRFTATFLMLAEDCDRSQVLRN